jgi:hypothetical protein
MSNKKNQNLQKGTALFLAVVILGVMLAIALGISTILVSQIRVFRGMENSVQAFFAADTGIERNLFNGFLGSGTLSNGATYQVESVPPNSIRSKGSFRESQRAIQVTR